MSSVPKTPSRDVRRRGGGDNLSAIALTRMPMRTLAQRGEAFGLTTMVMANLGTNNVERILRLWLEADRWREFDYQPSIGGVCKVRLLPGEFDYFLALLDVTPEFVDKNVLDHPLKLDVFAHIGSEGNGNRRPQTEVRATL